MTGPRLLSPELIALANVKLEKYMREVEGDQCRRLREKRYPVFVVDEEVREYYRVYGEEESRLREVVKELNTIVKRAAEEALWVRVALEHLPPLAVAALVACPPEYTLKPWGPVVHSWTWVQMYFLVTRKKDGDVHRPLVARYFCRHLHMRWLQLRRLERRGELDKMFNGCSVLANFYKLKKAEEAKKPGVRSEAHASKRAFRDVVRVVLGCAWLTAMMEMLDRGLINASDIDIPYILARNPAHTLHDPNEILVTFKVPEHYTWRHLLNILRLPR